MDNNDSCVYLNKYQLIALLNSVLKLKENKDFNDEIADLFIADGFKELARITENEIKFPKIYLFFQKNERIIKLPKNLFDYIENITDIDVFDKKTMKKFIDEFSREINENLKKNDKSEVYKQIFKSK